MKIGCCGFQVSRNKYFKILRLVEVQKTFYKPPRISTLEKWRKEAPSDFEFTVKAWMAFTHDPRSRIWSKTGLPKEDYYGLLRPTTRNFDIWEEFKEVARKLDAKVIVFQSPPSFKATKENVNNADKFFSYIKGEFELAWEVRDESWLSSKEFYLILRNHNITHVVDLLHETPIYGKFRYYRLHGGRKGKKIIYSYKYGEKDLLKIIDLIRKFQLKKNYVLFNNSYYSFENAIQLKEMLSRSQSR